MAHSVTCDSCGSAQVVAQPWGPQNDWRVALPEGWWLVAAAPANSELSRDQHRHVCSPYCAQAAIAQLTGHQLVDVVVRALPAAEVPA